MLLLVAITAFPAIYLLQASFFDFTLLGDSRDFVAFDNYLEVISSSSLRSSIVKMVGFVVAVVALELAIGLVLAVGLAKRTWFNQVASTMLLLPLAITPAVSALVFRQLLNPNFGWVDHYLRALGIMDRPLEWLSHPVTAWMSIIGLDVWQWTAFVALILMAGLQAMPREPYEAAVVDGASDLQIFRFVTLPMLRPFIGIAVVLRVIQAFKTFDSFKVLTDGGPTDSTEIVNLVIHRIALQSFRIGDAAALGIVLLIIVSALAPLVLRLLGSNEGVAR
ncbi:MAG TPA: sugar ABC transporter permease [Acidimicrobiia bacterium]|nr:sugar ABC transporter permease [Acidimicrobiia bacterium]